MSEIRFDLIHNEYALISPERLHRPNLYATVGNKSLDNRQYDCPFCEGNEHLTPPEIFAIRNNEPNKAGWKVRVIPNLYKAVQIETPFGSKEAGHYEVWNGYGAHEVIIDTPRHITKMNQLSKDEYYNWLHVLRLRVADLKNDKRMVYVTLFKNHGYYAGATQSHPHTQIIALPVLPKQKLSWFRYAFEYYKRNSRSIFDTVIEKEKSDAVRVIAENNYFIAFAPFASSFAFEVIIASKTQETSTIIDLTDKQINELAKFLRRIIRAFYNQLGDFDFNLVFGLPPLNKNYVSEEFFDKLNLFWRFHIRILPRLFSLGGFEFESGVYINPVLPEDAAAFLRDSLEGE